MPNHFDSESNGILLTNANLIDCIGKNVRSGMDVLIQNKRIAWIGRAGESPRQDNVRSIDLSGHTILPGMMDLHVHLSMGKKDTELFKSSLYQSKEMMALRAYERAVRTMEMGFTTLRDVGDIGYVTCAVRDVIQEGVLAGPRILTSGQYVGPTGGHGDYIPPWLIRSDIEPNTADGIHGMILAVRRQIKRDVDWVKLLATAGVIKKPWIEQVFTDEEMRAFVQEAHLKKKKVAAHCVHEKGTTAAIRAGADTIEHGTCLSDESISLMKESGTALVPTLSAPYFMAENAEAIGMSVEAKDNAKKFLDIHIESFRKAHEAGVKIAFGTDSGLPSSRHGENAKELELMVRFGMNPMEAIISATRSAAEVLGLEEEVGTVEENKVADLIAVKGDPIKDIKVFQCGGNVAMVVKQGSLVVSP